MTRPGYGGTGPGEITPDGCAVELYRRLPVGGEPEIVTAAVPPPATLLELGCGTGRVTGALAKAGYDVTAVDESAAMLAHVTGARTVRGPIEELALPKRFDVVLLGSFLVHGPSAARLLRTCRRHVADGGRVLIQREGADWHDRVPPESRVGDGVARVVSDEPAGDGLRSVHVDYEFPDGRWTQTFVTRPLTVAAFEGLLVEAGLGVDRYLTSDGTWAAATTVTGGRPG
jgi:SAM-dependent methyltransferase